MANTINIQTGNVTAHPAMGTRLVILMYDGAIGALNKALAAIEEGDLEGRCKAVNMALDILTQLCMSLDHDQGGQVAGNLDKLYRFMIARLARTNLLNDPEPAREVLQLLDPLYQAWRTLDQQIAAGYARPDSIPAKPEIRAVG
jgi:flagellar protein FliS